jgi:hypothetical protein
MADYGICTNCECSLCYAHAKSLVDWLDRNATKEPPPDFLKVIQRGTHCSQCERALEIMTRSDNPPLLNRAIQAIDHLRTLRVLPWPGE